MSILKSITHNRSCLSLISIDTCDNILKINVAQWLLAQYMDISNGAVCSLRGKTFGFR